MSCYCALRPVVNHDPRMKVAEVNSFEECQRALQEVVKGARAPSL
jgi:hypothetical protein